MKNTSLILFLSVLAATASAQPNCSQTSVGLIPINDLGTGTYNGWTGGLYPNGSNYMPATHKSAGMALSQLIQPLDANGRADPINGKIGWLSIGMSNTTQETQAFIPLADSLPNKNPFLKLVDGAQGGKPAREISNPALPGYTQYWNTVSQRLSQAGVSSQQVQLIWYKEDNPAGSPVPTPLQEHFDSLLIQSKRIMNEIKTRFPNAKLCYVASRIYAGYATSTLNPEPYAYQNGWTMKKLIEDQINGDSMLKYSGANSNSPWLSWGVYQWADGTTPRSDGLTWICPDDFQNDGTHPSPTGRQKVANLLLNFFQTDSTSCPWFLNNCTLTIGINEMEKDFNFTIYPNPFSDYALLTATPAFNHATITLYNHLGQKIREINDVSGHSVKFDRDNLPPGLYFVTLKNQKTVTKTFKALIND